MQIRASEDVSHAVAVMGKESSLGRWRRVLRTHLKLRILGKVLWEEKFSNGCHVEGRCPCINHCRDGGESKFRGYASRPCRTVTAKTSLYSTSLFPPVSKITCLASHFEAFEPQSSIHLVAASRKMGILYKAANELALSQRPIPSLIASVPKDPRANRLEVLLELPD